MSSLRQEKIEEVVRRNVATFLARESNRDALVSVTHVEVSPDGKRGTVFISVLPDTKENAALNFTLRKRADMRNYLKTHMKIRAIPFLDVKIDLGEKARQKLDDIKFDN